MELPRFTSSRLVALSEHTSRTRLWGPANEFVGVRHCGDHGSRTSSVALDFSRSHRSPILLGMFFYLLWSSRSVISDTGDVHSFEMFRILPDRAKVWSIRFRHWFFICRAEPRYATGITEGLLSELAPSRTRARQRIEVGSIGFQWAQWALFGF